MKKWNKHFGIYGVAFCDNKILVIEKGRGPYKGRYDLPGGKIDRDESLVMNLEREFIEETNGYITVDRLITVQDFFVNGEKVQNPTHHIAFFYKVKINKIQDGISKVIENDFTTETNDALGVAWLSVDKIEEDIASPLLWYIIKNRLYMDNSKVMDYDAITYDDWEVK